MTEKTKHIGWATFHDCIIDEVVVERETATQFMSCKIGKVILSLQGKCE